jgi:transposase-like protein
MPRSLFAGSLTARLSSKRRWSADEARSVLERLTASGLTVRQFAERQGVDPQRLYRWRSVIGEGPSPAFVEITRPTSTARVEILLRSGHVVRVSEGFSEEALRRVVAILGDGAPPAC